MVDFWNRNWKYSIIDSWTTSPRTDGVCGNKYKKSYLFTEQCGNIMNYSNCIFFNSSSFSRDNYEINELSNIHLVYFFLFVEYFYLRIPYIHIYISIVINFRDRIDVNLFCKIVLLKYYCSNNRLKILFVVSIKRFKCYFLFYLHLFLIKYSFQWLIFQEYEKKNDVLCNFSYFFIFVNF